MSSKFKVSVSICLLLTVSVCICVQAPTVQSWGWTTHQFIETEAEGILSKNYPSFSTFFPHSTLYTWCIMPDQNKSFMPDGGGSSDWHYLDAESYNPLQYTGGELPWAMEWIFDNIVQYLKDGNWGTAAELMGAICHFTGDATMPLHATYNYTPGGNHSAFESEVNNHMSEISIPDNYVPHVLDNIFEAAMETLEDSFSFTKEGSNGGVNLTDFLESNVLWNDWIKSMVENRMTAAVQFTANVWYTAIVKAGLVIGSTATLTSHSSIYINGNDNFTLVNGVVAGSGIAGDPYIVENWAISASTATGIQIQNTTAYFIIQNCLVENGSSASTSGIYLDNVINGEVKNATIENNRNGVYLIRSKNNDVTKCDISSQSESGIRLDLSNNNIISGCNISNSLGTGMALENSSNNRIYHNNFANNTNQAHDDGSNYWDNGYPSGGNYWSNYSGVDNYQGENQNVPEGDGIGDTPYNIAGNANQDRYPLMKPWTPFGLVTPRSVLVGVKAGDWIKLDFTTSGASSETSLPQWVKVEFLSVDGTTVNMHVTMQMLDGTEQSDNVTVDVVTGGETFRPQGPPGENGATGQWPQSENRVQGAGFFMVRSGFVIPANSKTGDTIKLTSYSNVTIAGEDSKTYAGVDRTVVYASSSQRGTELTYYWDKQTGALVEVCAVSGDMTENFKATETNMWQAEPTTPTRGPLIAGVVGVIVVISIVAAVYMRRR